MEKPERVKIGCDWWDVQFEEVPNEDGQVCRGVCRVDDRTIVLKESLSDTRLMETFLHESLHAIDDCYRMNLNESQVNILGNALISFIRDNKINFLK